MTIGTELWKPVCALVHLEAFHKTSHTGVGRRFEWPLDLRAKLQVLWCGTKTMLPHIKTHRLLLREREEK